MKNLILLLTSLSFAGGSSAELFIPAPTLRFNVSAEELRGDCRMAQARAETALSKIASVPPAERNFDNTPWALDRALAVLSEEEASDVFLKQVAVSSSVRAAAGQCETEVNQFAIETYARGDLYQALKQYQAKNEALSGENGRLVSKQMLDFKRSGLELPERQRAELTAARKKIAELESRFARNIDEDKSFTLFTRADLDGASEDYLSRLEKVGDRYKVTLSYPDYFPFMENVRVPSSRKLLESKFDNRAAEQNVPLLREALELRLKAARLLGYHSHAEYQLAANRMAASPQIVNNFLVSLSRRLRPLGEEDLKRMRALKYIFEGETSDGVIHEWDWRFYDQQLKKIKFAVDSELIKEYFPSDLVVARTLEIYQKLLGLRFHRVENAAVWQPEVQLYEVLDAGRGNVIGWFYLDLFPREGKYSHAEALPLITARALTDGTFRKPVSAMVANLAKPTEGKPALLDHDQVWTFFHEFGHIMHFTLSRARYARFASGSTATDFVEAPSQMLENWAWAPESLRVLSGHYADHSKPLPPGLIDSLVAAKNADAGVIYLRQVFFAMIDMNYHSEHPPSDTTAAYAKLQESIRMVPMAEGTHPEASFGHIMNGYDAGYYGYLWSKVYAQDMFSLFEAGGVLNPELGKRYRTEILEPGASRDEADSLRAFLGREPQDTAFLKSIGLLPQ